VSLSTAQSAAPIELLREEKLMAVLTSPDLSSTAKVLYTVLHRHAGESGVVDDLRDDDLANMLSLHWGTVQNAKRELKNMGVIHTKQQRRGKPLRYTLVAIALALLTMTATTAPAKSAPGPSGNLYFRYSGREEIPVNRYFLQIGRANAGIETQPT
jgi:hypothetical protein